VEAFHAGGGVVIGTMATSRVVDDAPLLAWLAEAAE
jgi:hypothetical protein